MKKKIIYSSVLLTVLISTINSANAFIPGMPMYSTGGGSLENQSSSSTANTATNSTTGLTNTTSASADSSVATPVGSTTNTTSVGANPVNTDATSATNTNSVNPVTPVNMENAARMTPVANIEIGALKPVYVLIVNQNTDKSGLQYSATINFNTKESKLGDFNVSEKEQDNILKVSESEYTFTGIIAGHIDGGMVMLKDEGIKNIIINGKEIAFNNITRFKMDNGVEIVITKGTNDTIKQLISNYASKSEIIEPVKTAKTEEIKQIQESKINDIQQVKEIKKESVKEVTSNLKLQIEELKKNATAELKLLNDKLMNTNISTADINEIKNKMSELVKNTTVKIQELQKSAQPQKDVIINTAKDSISTIKQNLDAKKIEIKEKYKSIFKEKFEKKLQGMTLEKLNTINTLVDSITAKTETVNTGISTADIEKKASTLGQLLALKQIITDAINSKNTGSEDIQKVINAIEE